MGYWLSFHSASLRPLPCRISSFSCNKHLPKVLIKSPGNCCLCINVKWGSKISSYYILKEEKNDKIWFGKIHGWDLDHHAKISCLYWKWLFLGDQSYHVYSFDFEKKTPSKFKLEGFEDEIIVMHFSRKIVLYWFLGAGGHIHFPSASLIVSELQKLYYFQLTMKYKCSNFDANPKVNK